MSKIRTPRILAALACCMGGLLSASAIAQPANNTCGQNRASFTIPSTGGVVTQSVTGWTRDGAACSGTTGADVYYYFTPATAGPWRLDTCTSPSFDSVLSIHEDICPVAATTYADGATAAVACSDDSCGSSSRISSITLTPGETYIIRVARWSGTAAATFTLTVLDLGVTGACCNAAGVCTVVTAAACTTSFQGSGTGCSPNPCPQPPANDLCTAAEVIPATAIPFNASVTGNLLVAGPTTTITPGVCASSARDVFYSFTPVDSGSYTFTTCNSVTGTLDTVLSVHSACPADGSNSIGCSDDSCTGGVGPSTISNLALTGGTTYIIRVARWSTGAGGPFRLDITTGAFGACCDTAAGTCLLQSQASCPTGFQGDGTLCSPNPCLGACCNPTSGACTLTGSAACASPNVFQGTGTLCTPNPCPQPPPPANDECTAAVALTVGTAGSGQLTGATGTDISLCSATDVDVWFSVTPAASGTFTVTVTPSSTSDDAAAIAVFESCPPTPDVHLACTAQPGLGTVSTVTFSGVGGSTYFIRAGAFLGDAGSFSILVQGVTAGACCNDITGVCTLVTTGVCATGSTYQGDNTVCTPSPCPASGACCNDTTGTCSTTIQAACPSGSTWQGAATVCTPNPCPQPPPPANDDCASAVALTVGAAPIPGTTAAATQSQTGSCTGSTLDVFYSFNAAAAGTFTATVDSASTTLFSIIALDACGGAELACTGALVDPAVLTFSVPGAGTYYLRVATFVPGESFTVSISTTIAGACCNPVNGFCTISTTGAAGCASGTNYQGDNTVCTPNPCPQPPPPANDTCGTAQALALNVPFLGDNTAATGDGTEGPGGACYFTSPTNFSKAVWFTFTAPATGLYGITACGSSFDTLLSIFDGTCAAVGTELGCDDDNCDGITPPGSGLASIIAPVSLTGGQVYLIRLSSYTPTGSTTPSVGAYTITVTGTAPAGVCCRGATCSTAVAPAACVTTGTQWGASFSTASGTCNIAGNNTSPCCHANYDKSTDGIQVADIFAFLNDWFASSTFADFGGDGTVAPDVNDIFDFLNAWFAGGC